MSIPTPYRLTVRAYSAGVPDEYGDATSTWTDREIAVHGLAPGASEIDDPTRDAEEVAWTVYAPKGTTVSSRDVVLVDGEEFEVIGRVKDWSRGPWPHPDAGVVIELKRAEG